MAVGSKVHIYFVVGNNPDMSDMLPHLRGQGIMDLEFEGDGEVYAISHPSCASVTFSLQKKSQHLRLQSTKLPMSPVIKDLLLWLSSVMMVRSRVMVI